MGATLLINHPRWTWREWLRHELGDTPLLIADPSFSDYGWAGRISIYREGRVRGWRFVGATDSAQAPLAVLAGTSRLLREMPENYFLLAPSGLTGPATRELIYSMAEMVELDRCLIPSKSAYARWKWPWPTEAIEMEAQTPDYILRAHRRAKWVEMLDLGNLQEFDLADVVIQQARLGAGFKMDLSEWGGIGWAAGSVLHVVTDQDIDEYAAARLMDEAHARRISLIHPSEYRGLLCSLARSDGRDVGMGIVHSFDPQTQKLVLHTTAEEGSRANIVRLGLLKLDETGNEVGDLRPWTV